MSEEERGQSGEKSNFQELLDTKGIPRETLVQSCPVDNAEWFWESTLSFGKPLDTLGRILLLELVTLTLKWLRALLFIKKY